MVTLEGVAAAWKRLWDQESSLAALVPGGLHWQRASGDGTGVYAVMKVTEGEPEWNSGSTYLQPYMVELRVWSEAGAVATGTLQRAIEFTYYRDRNEDLWIEGADRVVDVRQVPGALEADEHRRDAKDQLLLSRKWEVTVQAQRPMKLA